jgi:hypothetical protein
VKVEVEQRRREEVEAWVRWSSDGGTDKRRHEEAEVRQRDRSDGESSGSG